MPPKPDKKIVFIDTNIFVKCALEEVEGLNLNTLEEILTKLDNEEILLILPENIKSEILKKIENKFKGIKENIGQRFSLSKPSENPKKNKQESNLLNRAIKIGGERAVKEIEKVYKKDFKIINKIFNHKNTKIVPLTDNIILAGMRRACLMRPPFTLKEDKAHFLKDQDCIAFEAILTHLEKERGSEFILCSDDPDYFTEEIENSENRSLCGEVISDIKLKGFRAKGYDNLLEMLKKEFQIEYTEKEIRAYDKLSDNVFVNQCGEKVDSYYPIKRSSEEIPHLKWNTRFCPFCGKNIEKELLGYINQIKGEIGGFAYDPISIILFICPFCKEYLGID